MRRKPRSIRSKIIVALVVPMLALSGLWGLAVRESVTDALTLLSVDDTRDQVWLPTGRMVDALQAERSKSHEFLATGRRGAAELRATRAVTDAAVADFRRLSSRYEAEGEPAAVTRARIAEANTAMGGLTRLRSQIDEGGIARAAVLNGYTGIITTAFSVLSSASALGEIQVERVMRAVVDIARVGELFSQEDAVITGATTAGRFGTGEYLELLQIIGALRAQIPAAGSALPTDVQARYLGMFGNPDFTAVRAAEDEIVRNGRPGGPVPVTGNAWKSAYDPAVRELGDFTLAGYDEAITEARRAGGTVLVRFGVAGGLGLLAIIVSLVLSIRIGRSVVRRLSLLSEAATDLAGRRLPEVVARLRMGEPVAVEGEALRPPPGDDEIAEVGAALAEVQRSAIESAVGEAALRRGMGQVLVNVARRNQGLIDRQAYALSQIPDEGARRSRPMVQAEQLAVQMRRYAEHLVILAGSARTRGGLQPEPLEEIIAAAAGEVQDAERIEIESVADIALPGRVASDLGHLFAELMENATSFSPPDTPVRVSARRVRRGVLVEIEDRGLGMTPAALEETNRRLVRPPDFDPANSARLGLYVVAVLAAQRGVRVELEPSRFGGITALVTIPPDLAEGREPSRQLTPAGQEPGGAAQPPSLSAALAGMHRRNPDQ